MPKFTEITNTEYHVHHINTIRTIAKADRGASKGSTFACTYFGTPYTLVVNNGFTKAKAERIHTAFHMQHEHYFDFIDAKAKQAEIDGYIKLAYGLRLNTPALHASIAGTRVSPNAVDAEYRSIGNAIGQGYGAINSVAAARFLRRVYASKYRYTITLQALIHRWWM